MMRLIDCELAARVPIDSKCNESLQDISLVLACSKRLWMEELSIFIS